MVTSSRLAFAQPSAEPAEGRRAPSADSASVNIGAPTLGLEQTEPIVQVNPGIAATYLGEPFFLEPNLLRVNGGHVQVIGETGAWASQAALLSIVANERYGNDGPQGAFWDPNYRMAYAGQDAAALYLQISGRTPIVQALLVESFAQTDIQTPTGIRPVFTIELARPLNTSELAAINARPPNLRIETESGFFGYLISPGQVSPSGTLVPPVSADGRTLVVDAWTRAEGAKQVSASAHAVPSSFSSAPYRITIDATHQIDMSYGGWRLSDADVVHTAIGDERAFVNNKTRAAPINLFDPLTTDTLVLGQLAGVQSDHPGGSGVGVADILCTVGWQACFVARNMTTPSTGETYGFLAPYAGPSWGFYSTQGSGRVLGADPGNSCNTTGKVCRRTVVVDVQGNAYFAGSVVSGGTLIGHGLQLDGMIELRPTLDRPPTAHLDGITGNIVTTGFVVPGSYTMERVARDCSPAYPGAHVYISDGRKPGEATGQGSGVPADCSQVRKDGPWTWISVYDHAAVLT